MIKLLVCGAACAPVVWRRWPTASSRSCSSRAAAAFRRGPERGPVAKASRKPAATTVAPPVSGRARPPPEGGGIRVGSLQLYRDRGTHALMLEDEQVGALLPGAGRRLEEQIAKSGARAIDDEVVGDGSPPG